MELHADFSERLLLHAPQIDWLPSPMPGVHRRMLDRIGDEVARATTIVRYAPGSAFSPHVHGGGEEFVVLEGVFQDEHGDYPAGTYVRNPPTSRHTPGSGPGCVIFVKLWQFDPDDRHQMSVTMADLPRRPLPGHAGVSGVVLFEDPHERVEYQTWASGCAVSRALPGGAEVLVLDGTVEVDGQRLQAQSWLRVPAGGHLTGTAGADGASVWMKTGHLRSIAPPPDPAA